jgi:POT family proton-dependent oligopeptide transporter
LWRWQAKRGREPRDVAKIGIGAGLIGVSALILAAGSALADGGPIPAYWPLIGFFGMGIAFLYFWPVLLALVSQAAPAKVNATLMGGAFLSLFAGSVLMGWVGSFYDRMSPAAFWTLDAGIAFAGAVLIAILNRPLARALEPPEA